MGQTIRNMLRSWVPPALLRILRNKRAIKWCGNYASWEKARKATTGYEEPFILDQVKEAMLKVRSAEAAYERDSILFDEIHYSWPLLAGLMWVAAQSGGSLQILDFGGSLGSTYFQNKRFLDTLCSVRWNIVEQEHFVRAGKTQFQNDVLRFYHSIDDCLRETALNAALFSSVLQYLEKPYALLQQVKALSLPFILIDRTGFIESGKDRLTVQKVPPTIYRASYPCWFFDRKRFLLFLDDKYDLIAEFDALAGTLRLDCGQVATDKGFIFRRRSHT